MKQDKKAFYDRFLTQLKAASHWPSLYIFKFVLPTNTEKIHQLTLLFADLKPEMSSKVSSNKKYTSITFKATLDSAETVIEYYKKTEEIEGIIAL